MEVPQKLCEQQRIYIAGDIPYNVASEGCDLWESPQLF